MSFLRVSSHGGSRLRLVVRVFAVLLVVGLAAPHAWAWYHLDHAKSELGRYHPAAARSSLGKCLGVWPDHAEARLLASRAARQEGDFEAADRELRTCQRAQGGTSEAVAFEWALFQAAVGGVREVEDYLQKLAEEGPAQAALVWEALIEGYLRVFRILDAKLMVDHWLESDPDNVRALELRGITFITGRGVVRGSEDLRRSVELDPGRDNTRWLLVRALIDLGGYSEAATHLEWLAARHPDDPEVVVRLARCYNMTGRGAEARRMADEALTRHPDHGLLLRTRGQFALADVPPAPADAERWLRRAVEVMSEDYQSLWLLHEALRQQGKDAEAKAVLQRAEEVKSRTEQLSELRSRKLADQPLDPGLRYEMGMLLLQSGQAEAGERWLQGALILDPLFKPAHAALAEFYEKQGDKARAAEHRRQAGE